MGPAASRCGQPTLASARGCSGQEEGGTGPRGGGSVGALTQGGGGDRILALFGSADPSSPIQIAAPSPRRRGIDLFLQAVLQPAPPPGRPVGQPIPVQD